MQEKREKIVNKIRLEQRNKIFQSRRHMNKDQNSDFPLLIELQREEIERQKPILQTLPPFIQNLSEQHILKCLHLCRKCLKDRIILEEATACLIEITNQRNLSTAIKEELEFHIFRELFMIFEQSSNMEVIVNCIYIFGNSETGGGSVGKQEKRQMIRLVIGKIELLCMHYPSYYSLVELTIWYLRSIILMGVYPQLHGVTITISNKIIKNTYDKLNKNSDSKLIQLIVECFQLISVVITYTHNKEDCLLQIDHTISLILNHTALTAQNTIINHIGEIFMILIQHLSFIDSMIAYALMASCQRLRCGNCLSVCSSLLDVKKTTIPMHIKENITNNLITNIPLFLSSQEIILNRDYRIGFIDCLTSVFMNVRASVRQLMDERIVENLMNMMQLVFIDMDQDNVIKGLKLIMYLTQNMELPSAMAEICVSIGLDKSIIALQDRPNPEVYNAATDVLDLLSIQS